MKRKWILLPALAATVLVLSQLDTRPTQSQSVIAEEDVSALMHRKLGSAKNILEGLTLEQYDKIASNARSLRLLSMEAGWKVIQTEEYQKQSADFRRVCDSIEKAAKARDVNRAALGYVALTIRCVECHSYMRENKIEFAKLDR